MSALASPASSRSHVLRVRVPDTRTTRNVDAEGALGTGSNRNFDGGRAPIIIREEQA